MNPHEEHQARAKKKLKVRIVTVSTSRHSQAERGERPIDESGDLAESELKKLGHSVTSRELVSDDAPMIRDRMTGFLSGDDDVIIFTGGTGVSPRDVTIETVRPFFEKELEGFGELLRHLSYDEVGPAAMLTRTTMGVAEGKLIVCLPGSPGAVRIALTKLSVEFSHAVYVAQS